MIVGGETARVVAGQMATAATAWLAALDPDQRTVAQRPGPSDGAGAEAERLRWSYLPTDHGGLPLGRQRPAPQQLALRLGSTRLSGAGYGTRCGGIGPGD